MLPVLEQANAGPGPARNAGFRAATGHLFAFLDSDDEWDEAFLAEQVAILDARPDIDVVVGNARNRGGPRDGQPSRPVRGEGRVIALAEILADETSLFIMAVFRREVVDTIGGFDPALLTNEEYEMWIRAALAGFTTLIFVGAYFVDLTDTARRPSDYQRVRHPQEIVRVPYPPGGRQY